MKTTFANDPKYKEVFHSSVHNVKLYIPVDVANGYHMSRYVAAGAQNIYAAGGATKQLLGSMMDKMLELCNEEKSTKTLRTDIATLANNIKYRLQYPVDEDCALRMGAIYCFAEGEEPNQMEDYWTARKVAWAKGDAAQNIAPDAELYSFFLSLGIASTPAWKELSDTLIDTNYFKTRTDNLNALMPTSAR
ncbi:MAG: hypothetical protein R2800_08135 [Flavipsychrobacter sp.]